MFNGEMPTILCDAVPFCFGPISKLLTVTEQLSKDNRISILASGTSKQLANKTHVDSLITCNTENLKELKEQEMRIKTSDLFINIMNPTSAQFVSKIKKPQMQIDSLFWMWETIPQEILDSEIYFIQNFEGVEKQLTKYYDKIKNPKLIGPIVKEPPKTERKNKLIINLGGMESASIKIGKNSNYPFTIAEILNNIAPKLEFDEILCLGNGKIMDQIQKNNSSKKVKYGFLGHDDFIKELAEAKMLITSPGLTTSFEAFNAKTPTFFLPPQNYSQFWNLKGFKNNDLAENALNWDDYYEINMRENEDELKGIKKVLSSVNKFEKDMKQHKKLEYYIIQATQNDKNSLSKIARKQNHYFNKLGGNGAPIIKKEVNNYLERI